MITLYQFSPVWGIPNLSHFCVKVETYLRMTQLPYDIIETLPLKAPLGKLPYLEDQGQKIADSRLIIHYLQAQYGHALDEHLNAEAQAIAKAWQRLFEEHLYWLSMYTRWNYSEENWQQNKQAVFHVLPKALQSIAALGYRFLIKKQIYGQGTGRLSDKDIFTFAAEDISAIAIFLGQKDYFMGDRPSSIDATVYGFLVNIMACPIESPLKDEVLTQTVLVAYCQRMQARYFPELQDKMEKY